MERDFQATHPEGTERTQIRTRVAIRQPPAVGNALDAVLDERLLNGELFSPRILNDPLYRTSVWLEAAKRANAKKRGRKQKPPAKELTQGRAHSTLRTTD
jgi:hypothetical protein